METAETGLEYEGRAASLSNMELTAIENFATGTPVSGYSPANVGPYSAALGDYIAPP
jgi:hypothetical protein